MPSPLAAPYSYFADGNGAPLSGGSVYTYSAGTTTPKASYSDSTGATPLANPVVLDSAGRAQIWLSGSYKIVVKDSVGNTISTADNVTGSSNSAQIPWAVAAGTADAITATYNPANTSLVDGLLLSFRATGPNATTTPTFSPDGLTARTITKNGGTALAAGDIAANLADYLLIYDLANTRWELLNPVSINSPHGQCQLQRSSSTAVILMPFKGNKVTFPNGYNYSVPSAGLASGSISGGCNLNGTGSSTLVAATLYYCYLWYNAGTPALDFSATAHSTDANTGIEIKTGDATRVLVGMIYPTAGPVVVDSGANRLVASWFNPKNKGFANAFTTNRTSTNSSYTEINTEIRCQILSWGDALTANYSGSVQESVSAGNLGTGITIDGVSTFVAGASSTNCVNNNVPYNAACGGSYTPSEGFHYLTIAGAVSANTGTWLQQGNSVTSTGLTGSVNI